MIYLNDILRFDDLDNVKIRFNLMFGGNWSPTDIYKQQDLSTLLDGHYWNYKTKKSYKVGQITVGFLKIEGNRFLLFHVGRVTQDLNVLDGVGYQYESLPQYDKYCGRLVIEFKNKSQAMIRKAGSVIGDCKVAQILADDFGNDRFPGYDNVRLSWRDLAAVVQKENWKTALQNQKAVYLITDTSNGKMYVGSASGEHMLLGRWQAYVNTGHGQNQGLKPLPFEHIQSHFEYSILEIFKSTTDDKMILNRESWWKNTLKTRQFGYNKN
ncbi:GIY-YIG nuclease family protein [uncultured Ferrimonas sp.]|uniref:GIY-YIG nuclease family protein n=1 Tax=uncultured Ferrimonas sp. TaxID=432640 RepID=UPI002638F3C3|nr:GIY-YIG nuclease family protein [uncultured Ferrimonas sp.]